MKRSTELASTGTAATPWSTTPTTETTGDPATLLAGVLGDLLNTAHVPHESNFFDDLGADSLVMAHFCAKVRKHPELPTLSMKDVYRNPTISALSVVCRPDRQETEATRVPPLAPPAPPRGRPRPVLCGTLQLLFFVAYTTLLSWLTELAFQWMSQATGPWETHLRAIGLGAATFLLLCLLPIAAKWLLVGRWRPWQPRIWSLSYLRFWLVRVLVRTSPLVLFVGSPLYVWYLKALGAKIGRNVTILSRHVPICTDLLTLGDDTVIRKDSFFQCYRARAGMIEMGPVSTGRNVDIGENSVVDIAASLDDDAVLGRCSALHATQRVPRGEYWVGSPAARTDGTSRPAPTAPRSPLRRVLYSAVQLMLVTIVVLPAVVTLLSLLLSGVPQLRDLWEPASMAWLTGGFYLGTLATSFVLFFGMVIVGLLVTTTVPRLLNLGLRPGRGYRLYGLRYWTQRAVTRLSNLRFFTSLLGDSSYIVPYLRGLGYDLSPVVQTGSNFGLTVMHDNPQLCRVGSGTMIADGLSMINIEYSSTAFRVSHASISGHNFLGNLVVYPPRGRTGENCLLATKVRVPVDGEQHSEHGLLGSPSMRIPRSVQRDSRFDDCDGPAARARALPAKNRHNLVSMALFLLVRWLHLYAMTLFAAVATDVFHVFGFLAVGAAAVSSLVFTVGYSVLVERIVIAVHPVRPLFCSIYDRRFWRHERYWKIPETAYLNLFNGTPFKGPILRLLGVRIGARVFDDGGYLSERRLTRIGDDCVLNAGTNIQCHSQEDGTFKSDHSALGDRSTVGVHALVHYGTQLAEDGVLEADSFLMKGEEVPAAARWAGNPAREFTPAPDVPGGASALR